MEGSYSQLGPVNVCYCLRKAKWLLYISLRSYHNVLSADEMKKREERLKGKDVVKEKGGGRKLKMKGGNREIAAEVTEVD